MRASYSVSENRCRRLVRRIVHTFLTAEHSVVMDAVLRNPGPKGYTVAQIMEQVKLCRRTSQLKLNDLYRAGFISCESTKELTGKAKLGTGNMHLFVFDYRKFVTRLAYRNLMVQEKFESEVQKATPEEKYICTNSSCADL
jgi:transcription initiation factor IIE alpha subunit